MVHVSKNSACFYSNRSNNQQGWLNGWTTLVPPSNDLVCPLIVQVYDIHPRITFNRALHSSMQII